MEKHTVGHGEALSDRESMRKGQEEGQFRV